MENHYPKSEVKTMKSKLDIEIEAAEKGLKERGGISFYCRKRDEYVFIPKNATS